MILTNLILLAGASGSGPIPQDTKPKVEWTAPESFLGGGGLTVHVEIVAPKDGASLPAWMLESSAFTVNGKPLVDKRSAGTLTLLPNARLSLDLDVGPLIESCKGFDGKDFKFGYGLEFVASEEKGVRFRQPADKGLDFMKIPVADLSKYRVLLQTNRGNMEVEFWPDVAPNHVRNFLDLSYTGFYNGTLFHRVGAKFMIQGGDPNTKGSDVTRWGQGQGPRMLGPEFNSKKHVRGVLSMARGSDPASGSSQFFIMNAENPGLDGKYSAFGLLVNGFETLEAIANAKGTVAPDSTVRPSEPQKILAAVVVKAPAPSPAGK